MIFKFNIFPFNEADVMQRPEIFIIHLLIVYLGHLEFFFLANIYI